MYLFVQLWRHQQDGTLYGRCNIIKGDSKNSQKKMAITWSCYWCLNIGAVSLEACPVKYLLYVCVSWRSRWLGKQTKKFVERILEAHQIGEKARFADQKLSFQERCPNYPNHSYDHLLLLPRWPRCWNLYGHQEHDSAPIMMVMAPVPLPHQIWNWPQTLHAKPAPEKWVHAT